MKFMILQAENARLRGVIAKLNADLAALRSQRSADSTVSTCTYNSKYCLCHIQQIVTVVTSDMGHFVF